MLQICINPTINKGERDPRKKFQCPSCQKGYLSKTALNRHIRYDCGKEPMFSCPHCSYRAYQKVHVATHMSKTHVNEYYGDTEKFKK
ncbi:hypothetical protein QE152_g15548 [Popillia japonica]|uniref:C2H2-type domain-containing protein n=1 Tax=Popillia japonica TaxID=7064 RepID=A0AAW1L992_POPJA